MGISTGTGSRRPWGAVGGPLVPLLPASPHPTLPLGFTRSNAEPPAPLSSPPQLPEPPMPHTPGSGVWRGLAGTATPGPPTNPVPGVPRSWGGVPIHPGTPWPGDGSPGGAPAGSRTHVLGSEGPERQLDRSGVSRFPAWSCPTMSPLMLGVPQPGWGAPGGIAAPLDPPAWPARTGLSGREGGCSPGLGGPWCSLMWLQS